MMKILIPLMLVLSFLVSSCSVEDDNSCVNEDEERIIPCATDNMKEQRQVCSQGEWIDSGPCFFCEEFSTQTIPCATDNTKEQKQRCSQGAWVDEGECTCPENNKFCHSHDGLKWSDVLRNSGTWDEAVTYCKDLGGRLPTISELRTLIQNCPATETGGECGVTDSCLSEDDCWGWDVCWGCSENGVSHSVLGDTGEYWSSSLVSDEPDFAWLVNFNLGQIEWYRLSAPCYVRCVR